MKTPYFLSPLYVRLTLYGFAIGIFTTPAIAKQSYPLLQKPNAGDTAWILISAALVFLMTPALSFFYGGLVRSKNVLNTVLLSFSAAGTIGVLWAIIGYSIAFAPGNAFIGGLHYVFLRNVGYGVAPHAPTVPHLAFMAYQGMFAIIAPAIISGAVVERIKFRSFLVFCIGWSLLVYAPVAHWVWGGGWLQKLGFVDFAGGAVIHISVGFAALLAAILVGNRRDHRDKEPLRPHNLPFTLLGVGLLWFGWFGFNGGSAFSSGELAAVAFTNTQLGAATAMLTWMFLDQFSRGEITAMGIASGAIAGEVGVTPGAGFVSPLGAMAIGVIVTIVCFYAMRLRAKTSLDDTLDAFAFHGVGGVMGIVLTGIFATSSLGVVNHLAKSGLFEGNFELLRIQALGAIAVIAYTVTISFLLLKGINWAWGLRENEESEHRGLDKSVHGENAYNEESEYRLSMWR